MQNRLRKESGKAQIHFVKLLICLGVAKIMGWRTWSLDDI